MDPRRRIYLGVFSPRWRDRYNRRLGAKTAPSLPGNFSITIQAARASARLYDIANQRIAFRPSDSPLRQGSYRGLAATANHFARESFMDELAHAAKMDPLEFRIKNLKDERLRAVFKPPLKNFGWGANKTQCGPGIRHRRRGRERWQRSHLRGSSSGQADRRSPRRARGHSI